jgi:hypothetical protein
MLAEVVDWECYREVGSSHLRHRLDRLRLLVYHHPETTQ